MSAWQTLRDDQRRTLVARCRVASDFLSRFLGLMFRPALPADEAILFPACNSIHTFFMRFPIDVVFIAAEGQIVRIDRAFRPWRLRLPVRGARHTLELAAGEADRLGLREGQRLDWGSAI